MKILPFALMLHIAVSIYNYGSLEIYPNDLYVSSITTTNRDVNFYGVESPKILDRVWLFIRLETYFGVLYF